MDDGLVRGILWRHLADAQPRTGAAWPRPGAADLVPAAPFADALAAVARAHGEAELRRLADDWVALWARTFRTLVSHLRGRPERALRLWAEEVYPFLRGHRLAARLESASAGAARLALADDLPAPFLARLVEAFVGLSGARARCEPRGAGVFEVRYRVAAGQRFAALVQQAALLRVPLLACVLLAGLAGVAAGWPLAPHPSWAFAAAALAGLLAAQAGANGLADLRPGRDAGPLGPLRPGRAWSWTQSLGCYAVAAAAGAFLFLRGRPLVALLAALGLAAGLLYGRVRDQGAGPLVAGVTYGPLAVAGSAYAVAGPAAFGEAALWTAVGPGSAAVGCLAAALLFVDDLADRPLDEAGGRRTLVVRLPQRRHVAVFAGLLAAGLLALLAAGALGGNPALLTWGLLGGLPAALLVRRVRVHLDDPQGLAAARAGALGLLAGASLVLSLAFGGAL